MKFHISDTTKEAIPYVVVIAICIFTFFKAWSCSSVSIAEENQVLVKACIAAGLYKEQCESYDRYQLLQIRDANFKKLTEANKLYINKDYKEF